MPCRSRRRALEALLALRAIACNGAQAGAVAVMPRHCSAAALGTSIPACPRPAKQPARTCGRALPAPIHALL